MTPEHIRAILTAEMGYLKPFEKQEIKSWNKAVYGFSSKLSHEIAREAKAKAKEVRSTNASVSEQIQDFMDNPMSDEDEAKALRAIYHMNLSTGELSPALLDKLDKIIGVGTGKDEEIQIVDFKDAFPSYAEAIRICSTPQPEVE